MIWYDHVVTESAHRMKHHVIDTCQRDFDFEPLDYETKPAEVS